MQLLFEHSVELEPTDGLGLIAGDGLAAADGRLRLPHIGWNEVRFERDCVLTADLPCGRPALLPRALVRGAARPIRRDVVATAEYGERFATIVAHGSVLGVQFHPEKSSADGLRDARAASSRSPRARRRAHRPAAAA